MYIRIKPGEKFRDHLSSWYGEMPLTMSPEAFYKLRKMFSPEEWYVYSILLHYEHIKLGTATPTLETMWAEEAKDYMDQETFDQVIENILTVKINLNESGLSLNLVEFINEAESLAGSEDGEFCGG